MLVDPLKYVRICGNSDLADYVPVFRWEYADPTRKQLDLLKAKGIDVSPINTRGFASAIIDQIMESAKKGLATPKQIQCLEGFGYTGVSEWTKTQATSTLTRLLGKTWDLPQDLQR